MSEYLAGGAGLEDAGFLGEGVDALLGLLSNQKHHKNLKTLQLDKMTVRAKHCVMKQHIEQH